jgi:alpha-tubulin suppressor-like RCC1 family protein
MLRSRVPGRQWYLQVVLATVAACSDPVGIEPVALAIPLHDLSSGGHFSCLLRNEGRAVCWGRWGTTATNFPATEMNPPSSQPAFAVVSAGASYACALTVSGEAFCWGLNDSGQLGDGSLISRDVPVPVQTAQRFAAIAAGSKTTCAITPSGRRFCWGANMEGEFGNGTQGADKGSIVPVAVGGPALKQLSGGTVFCGVTTSGPAVCWAHAAGSFDDQWVEPGACSSRFYYQFLSGGCLSPTNLEGSKAFDVVSVRGATQCGLNSTTAYCWGDGSRGALGDGRSGSGIHAVAPLAVAGSVLFGTVSVGATHVCGLTTSHAAYCWGNNFRGYLGTGQTGGVGALPIAVAGQLSFERIAAGSFHTCAVTTEGSVWCWGAGTEGQLGRAAELGDANNPLMVNLPNP